VVHPRCAHLQVLNDTRYVRQTQQNCKTRLIGRRQPKVAEFKRAVNVQDGRKVRGLVRSRRTSSLLLPNARKLSSFFVLYEEAVECHYRLWFLNAASGTWLLRLALHPSSLIWCLLRTVDMTKPRLDLYGGLSGTFCRHCSVSVSFDISDFFFVLCRVQWLSESLAMYLS